MNCPFSTRTPRTLLVGALSALGGALVSGVFLDWAPQPLLIMHLLSAGAGGLPVVLFLQRHWWQRRRAVLQHANARLGFVALSCLLLLLGSGVLLLVWTNVPPLRWLHISATAVLVVDLSVHMAWRLRRRWALGKTLPSPPLPSSPPAQPSQQRGRLRLPRTWGWVLCAALGGGGLVVLSQVTAITQQAQPVSLAHNALNQRQLSSAQDCANCHTDVTSHWQVSAHANAATDQYYQALTTLFIQERGPEAVRYCASCHNPVGLMQGEIDVQAAQRIAAQSGATAYESRKLGVVLPISARASEGVTCSVCHQAAHVAQNSASGTEPTNLQFDLRGNLLPNDVVAQISLRAAPNQHTQAMLRSTLNQAELCGACHNLRLPDNGMLLEPTYDEWKASPYAARGITCQNCHMPAREGRMVNSGLPGLVAAHGGMPGVPSSLPKLANSAQLLRAAATLSIANVEANGRGLRATLLITNSGAGHYLPTGADDLRQVWLEATLVDEAGQTVWQSGQINQYGELDPSAIRFGKVLGDAQNQPIALHRFWMATQILQDTRLAPFEVRTMTYDIPTHTPATASPARYQLQARLLYRDVSQAFAEFALNRPVSAANLPTHEMATTTLSFTR